MDASGVYSNSSPLPPFWFPGLSTPIQTRHSRHLNPKLLIALSRPLSGMVIFPTCNPTKNPTISFTDPSSRPMKVSVDD